MLPVINPLTWSSFQFNCLLAILAAAFLLPAVITFYFLILTLKIESARKELSEIQEP